MHFAQTANTQMPEKSGAAFFTNGFNKKLFFSPAIQLKPAGEHAAEKPQDASFDMNEWNKMFDQARQDLCTLQHELFKQAINTASKINSKTPEVLDAFIGVASTCSSISAYIKQPKKIVGSKVYKTYGHSYADDFTGNREGKDRFDANPWHRAVKDYLHEEDRDKIRGVGGFYDRSKDTINLPVDATLGRALHESMHRLSGTMFMNLTWKREESSFLNEGATQYFTDRVLADVGLPKMQGHDYGKNVAAIENLVRKMNGNFHPLARIYFLSDLTGLDDILSSLQLPGRKNIRNPGQQIYDAVKTQ